MAGDLRSSGPTLALENLIAELINERIGTSHDESTFRVSPRIIDGAHYDKRLCHLLARCSSLRSAGVIVDWHNDLTKQLAPTAYVASWRCWCFASEASAAFRANAFAFDYYTDE
jgi:hypothetical protein